MILDDGLALEGEEGVGLVFTVLSAPPSRVLFETRYHEATVVILDDDGE